jgi:hypothetical protein
MDVQVHVLCQGKADGITYDDACAVSPERGLFAIADGAGTSFCSGPWARTLVEQFLRVPLRSADPFEVAWWLRAAQEVYKQASTQPAQRNWKVQQAAREGAASTLAAFRVSAIHGTTLEAHLLALGDSCIFYAGGTEAVNSFPLHEAAAFGHTPLCLPSLPRKFHRDRQQLVSRHIQLPVGSTVLLATDAVARWILAHEGQARQDAFWGIAGMTSETWSAFIAGCRQRDEMPDDDASVILLRFIKGGKTLGYVSRSPQAVIEERYQALMEAIAANDKEQIALTYGDGHAFAKHPLPLSQEQIHDARCIAHALEEVRQIYLNTFRSPQATALVTEVWHKYEALFGRQENRASVEKLLSQLQQHGVLQEVILAPIPEDAPAAPARTFWQWLLSLIGLKG